MNTVIPLAHFALSFVIIVWDIVLAGRIAQLRQASRSFAAMSGLAALLVLPAAILQLATSTVVTGRAVVAVDWIWPAALVLFAVQAVYALVWRLVNPTWGVPIAAYDIVVAIVGLVRYSMAHGMPIPDFLLVLMAAQSNALAFLDGPAALASPFFLMVPMVSPAFPALRPLTASFRFVLSLMAVGWLVVVTINLPAAATAVRSYDAHAGERLTERNGNFAVGVKLLPDAANPPPPAAIVNDIALADTLGVAVVKVIVVPDASNRVLDSLSHSLDQLQRDSVLLIVSLGYRGDLMPELRHARLNEAQRLAAIPRIVRHLDPDVLLPAEDPYGEGARLLGRLSVQRWTDYITRAAQAGRRVNPRLRIGVSISAFDSRDSALYAWAAAPGSPVDIVGFSLYPTRDGAAALDASTRAADRWMQIMPPAKDHWIFATGGFPLGHGERSQEEVIWDAMSWATAHTAIKGLVVHETGDYGKSMGLVAPNGRRRPATYALMRALRALRETGASP